MEEKIVSDIQIQVQRTGYPVRRILELYGIKRSTYYGWLEQRSAEPQKPRKNLFALLPEEESAILDFRKNHLGVSYKAFTHMLNDAHIAYASESTIYQLLKRHDCLKPNKSVSNANTSKEYKQKPSHVHHHWHVDIAYIKISGVFYFLVMMLDGYSRFILDWELMSDMLGSSVEDFVARVKEKYPYATPTLITDNGSQFISLDFKRLLSRLDIQHVRTRRNHPQTNGKIERLNGIVKEEAIRPACPSSYQEAWNILNNFIYFYNHQRLHGGIHYLRPADVFFGRKEQVLTIRTDNVTRARKVRFELNKINYASLIC